MTLSIFSKNSMTFPEIPENFKIPENPWLLHDRGNPVWKEIKHITWHTVHNSWMIFHLPLLWEWQRTFLHGHHDYIDHTHHVSCIPIHTPCAQMETASQGTCAGNLTTFLYFHQFSVITKKSSKATNPDYKWKYIVITTLKYIPC